MAERGRETFGALGVDNLIAISEESESESEEEEDQLRESRLGQLRGSSSGGDVAVSGNDLITLTAGYSVHLPLNYPSEGEFCSFVFWSSLGIDMICVLAFSWLYV